mmetsp:Transcript_36678/g.105600  ORF Transcript_36678/g.105600 Transcript_36678/m.105600 type:complete len:293 (-) Transcript_36678:1452-2330(-)
MASTRGPMARGSRASGAATTLAAPALIGAPAGGATVASGSTPRCTASGASLGQRVSCTRATLTRTQRRASASTESHTTARRIGAFGRAEPEMATAEQPGPSMSAGIAARCPSRPPRRKRQRRLATPASSTGSAPRAAAARRRPVTRRRRTAGRSSSAAVAGRRRRQSRRRVGTKAALGNIASSEDLWSLRKARCLPRSTGRRPSRRRSPPYSPRRNPFTCRWVKVICLHTDFLRSSPRTPWTQRSTRRGGEMSRRRGRRPLWTRPSASKSCKTRRGGRQAPKKIPSSSSRRQ